MYNLSSRRAMYHAGWLHSSEAAADCRPVWSNSQTGRLTHSYHRIGNISGCSSSLLILPLTFCAFIYFLRIPLHSPRISVSEHSTNIRHWSKATHSQHTAVCSSILREISESLGRFRAPRSPCVGFDRYRCLTP